MKTLLKVLSVLLLPIYLFARPPARPPGDGKKISAPKVSFSGTDESQRWQNYIADIEHLVRIQNNEELVALEKSGALVLLPETETIRVDPRLKSDTDYCYVLPRVSEFLKDLAVALTSDLPQRFFQINSAARDAVWQKNLQKNNPNAAAVSGPKASSHLTGATIDIAKLKVPPKQIKWMRKRLFLLAKKRMIWVTEETHQAVFHIMVFSTYKKGAALEKK